MTSALRWGSKGTSFYMSKLKFTSVLLFSLAPLALNAQTITGTITGSVTDPSGASLAKAKVTATNVGTGIKTNAATNDAGFYSLPFLNVGQYTVTVENPGFKKSLLGPFALEVNQIARVDIALQLGAVTESVEVKDFAPILQTESSATGASISASQVTSIPLRGRNFASAVLLIPGAITPNPTSFDGIGANTGGGRPYVNGNREQTNNFLLDGGDINESIDNLIGYQPNVDALQEVKVMTGNMGAEFGNANGAVVNMTLKSGTNSMHGNVFWFLQNDNLNANGLFSNRAGAARREFRRNVFGGTVGGPIVKNKAFFFLDYQGAKDRSAGPASASLAPEAWRTGNLSGLTRSVLDPTTNAPFPGNIIPTSRIVNPAARALFAEQRLYPLPNNRGVGPLGVTSNFLGSSSSAVNNDQADAKSDIRLTEKDNLMVRFSIRRLNSAPSSVVLPVVLGTLTSAPTTGGVIGWTRVVSPSVVNEFRVNVNRVRISDEPFDVAGLLGAEANARFGIPGGQPLAGLSSIALGATEGLGGIGSVGIKSDNITNTFQFSENLTWQKGKHFLKIGGQLIRYQQNRFYSGNNGVLGFLTYSGFKSGSSFGDFLLDQVSSKGRGSNSGNWGHRQSRIAMFVQDDYKLANNFTLNIGMRWEYNTPVYEVADRQVNVDVFTGKVRVAGKDGNSRALFNPYYKQFMPRVGFAWSPSALKRTVVRGGYGISSYLEGTGANLRLPLNPPFFFESNVDYGVGSPGSIREGFGGLVGSTQLQGLVRAWNPDLRPAFIQQFNFTLERQLTNSMSVSAGYVGQKGTHLVVPRDPNQPLNACPNPQLCRPLYNVLPLVTNIAYTDSSANMNYNGLQVSARQRSNSGFEYQLSYTLSKSMTDNLGYYGSGGVAAQSAYWQNAYDRKADYGPSFFDATHNMSFSGSYELPFGMKRKFGSSWNRATDIVLGGWQVGYILGFHTGFPMTLTSPNRSNRAARTARANRYQPLKITGQSIDNWFGTDASAKPCAADVNNGTCAYGVQFLNQFGSTGVGTERAPKYANLDMNVGKNFNITERQYIQFRAEFFNLPNMTSFGPPNRDTSAAQFGFINGQINTPRVIQFALKYMF